MDEKLKGSIDLMSLILAINLTPKGKSVVRKKRIGIQKEIEEKWRRPAYFEISSSRRNKQKRRHDL